MTIQPQYAGFWNRFAAVFIDVLILLIPQALFGHLVGMAFVNRMASTDLAQNHIGFEIWSRGIALGIAWLYFALLESSKYQATVGKMALGLVVTDLAGDRVSFGRASGRFFGKLLSAAIMGIGYLLAAFTPRKQALHDILAQCLVIKRLPSSASVSFPTTAETHIDDEPLYLTAKKELDENSMREGLWAKAFEQNPTDENLRRATYLRLRVTQLRAEDRANRPPPTPLRQRLSQSPFAKWCKTQNGKATLILVGFVSVFLLWPIVAEFDDVREWIRRMDEKRWTTLEAGHGWDDNYVHAQYTLNGERFISKNYQRICYHGKTVRLYKNVYSSKPDGVVDGATEVMVYRGRAISERSNLLSGSHPVHPPPLEDLVDVVPVEANGDSP